MTAVHTITLSCDTCSGQRLVIESVNNTHARAEAAAVGWRTRRVRASTAHAHRLLDICPGCVERR